MWENIQKFNARVSHLNDNGLRQKSVRYFFYCRLVLHSLHCMLIYYRHSGAVGQPIFGNRQTTSKHRPERKKLPRETKTTTQANKQNNRNLYLSSQDAVGWWPLMRTASTTKYMGGLSNQIANLMHHRTKCMTRYEISLTLYDLQYPFNDYNFPKREP